MQIDAQYNIDPLKNTEKELQSKLSTFLKDIGFQVANEVRAGGKGYIDIVAADSNTKIIYLIECKKRLKRNDFYTARGQIEWYASHYTGSCDLHKKMIIYGGLHRVEYDKNTISQNIIVMWYYDALHFFDAHQNTNVSGAANFENLEVDQSHIRDRPGGIASLKQIPEFVDFAHRKMADDAEFWRREAKAGTGIMQTAAAAVVEIGGEDLSDNQDAAVAGTGNPSSTER